MTLTVDGSPVQAPDQFVYKGMMLSGVPNFLFVFGYTNASWTLKVGLIGEHFSRLLSHMDARGYDTARPAAADPGMPSRPFTDFASGYIRRALTQLPRQGSRAPWRIAPTYSADRRLLRRRVDGPQLAFTSSGSSGGVSGGSPGGVAGGIGASHGRGAAGGAAAPDEEGPGRAARARL
jgi:hypothetical protein